MIKVSGKAMAPLHTNTQMGTMTEVKDLIPQAIMAYNDISGSKVVSGQNGHIDRPEVPSPSHHFMAIRYSLDLRCKAKLVEGTTDNHEEE